MELTAPERRIIGCLIEKERATPQNYPLTLNALRLACNQTTNRDPVTDYDETDLEEALASLRQQNLTRIVYSTSNRAAKYRHVVDEVWKLDGQELAVLAVLLLRGPQTIGEIKGRTERLAPFADLGEVQATLDRLASRDDPFVIRLERRPGQKDARWMHLLGSAEELAAAEETVAAAGVSRPTGGATGGGAGADPSLVAELRAEVDDLRTQLEEVQGQLADLRADFATFRSQFE